MRAWVRYPTAADRVQGPDPVLDSSGLYVEWEGSGTHRTWVWASVVEHATTNHQQSPSPTATGERGDHARHRTARRPHQRSISSKWRRVRNFYGAAGRPFGAVVFGSIDDHAVRLQFFIEPATNMCAVHLFDMITKKVFAERVAAPTFEKAIEGYPWAVAIDMLGIS